AYVLVALAALSSPGLLLASLVPWQLDLLLMIVVALVLSGLTYLNRRGLPGTEVKTSFNVVTFLLGHYLKFIIAAGVYVIGTSILLNVLVWLSSHALHFVGFGEALGFWAAFWPVVHVVILGLFSLLFLTVPLLL